jgi:hypothetical protein
MQSAKKPTHATVLLRFRNTNFDEYALFPGDNHVLNMRLVDHLFDDMLIEEAEVSYLLLFIPDMNNFLEK